MGAEIGPEVGRTKKAGFSGVAVDTVGYASFFRATALLGVAVGVLIWDSMKKMPASA